MAKIKKRVFKRNNYIILSILNKIFTNLTMNIINFIILSYKSLVERFLCYKTNTCYEIIMRTYMYIIIFQIRN